MNSILLIFGAAFCIRLVSLSISISHEKNLKAQGATEYGTFNSKVLSAAHVLYYVGSVFEAWQKKAEFNQYTIWGIGLFVFSMIMLAWVILSLKEIWTVKLYILKGHRLNTNALFRWIRHPNYFLNIIPELVAIAFICQSWNVFMIGFPLYMIPLVTRIIQEEKAMRAEFAQY